MLTKIFSSSFKRTYASDIKKISEMKRKFAAEKFEQKAVRVAILGASTLTGEYLSLMLKTNPLISHLYLHGDFATGTAADLSHIDMRTMTTGYGDAQLEKAIRCAEIIVILGIDKNSQGTTAEERFRGEYERLIKITRCCTMYAPKAIMYICVPPVSMSVPLVAGVFKKTHWYHPGRIIGSVDLYQVKLNSLLAQHNNLDPAGVHVPIVGGPDFDSIIPLFSRANPLGCEPQEAEHLTKTFKNIPSCEPVTMEVKKMDYSDAAPSANAYAIHRAVIALSLGILGDQNANLTGFIRSNILPTCKHMTSTLRAGPGGIVHNFGIPLLTPMELSLMEKAALLLNEREKKALDLLEQVDERKIAIRN